MATIRIQVQTPITATVTLTSLNRKDTGATVPLSPALPQNFTGPDGSGYYTFSFPDPAPNLKYRYGFTVTVPGAGEVEDTGIVSGSVVPTTLPANADPFTLVYGAIWSALLASDDWKAAVALAQAKNATAPFPAGNLVRFDNGNYQPDKAGVGNPAENDFPRVTLLQGRMQIIPAVNSLALGIAQTYPLVTTAQDWDINLFNGLKWQTVRALLAAGESLGMPKLVRTWDVTSATDVPRAGDDIVAIAGTNDRWVNVLAVNVEMSIPLASVAAGEIPTT